MSDQELRELERLVRGREPGVRPRLQQALVRAGRCASEAWTDLPVRLAVCDEEVAALASGGAAALRLDLGNLDPERLLAALPRDPDGRLPLGQLPVTLARYQTTRTLKRGREVWLAAAGPERRRDEQVVRLVLTDLVSENHPHCWEAARWHWDGRVELTEARRYGVEGLPLELLRPEARARGLKELRARRQTGRGGEGDLAALAVLLQETGGALEALRLYDVEVDASVQELLDPDRGPPWMRDAGWDRVMAEALRSMAPWQFAGALAAAPRKGKKGARLRLFAFPGQTQQSKSSLMLVEGPRLEVESTGWNQRLPEVHWKRSPALDELVTGARGPRTLA